MMTCKDPYGIRFWPNYKGRDGCRTPIPWISDNQNGGFSDSKPWLPMAVEHLQRAVGNQGGQGGQHACLLPRDDRLPPGLSGAGQGQFHVGAGTGAASCPSSASHEGLRVFCAFNLTNAALPVAPAAGRLAAGSGARPSRQRSARPRSRCRHTRLISARRRRPDRVGAPDDQRGGNGDMANLKLTDVREDIWRHRHGAA